MVKIPAINWASNILHEWGQPEQNPLKTIFLTRIGGVACAAIEMASCTARSALWIGIEFPCFAIRAAIIVITKVAPHWKLAERVDDWLPNLEWIEHDLLTVAQIIVGLASTLFFGIIFSPELNFRIHLELGLAVDNLAVKKERDLRDKLEAQQKAEVITKKRAADLEMQKEVSTPSEEIEDKKIDTELAEQLISCPQA